MARQGVSYCYYQEYFFLSILFEDHERDRITLRQVFLYIQRMRSVGKYKTNKTYNKIDYLFWVQYKINNLHQATNIILTADRPCCLAQTNTASVNVNI